ncbi:MAG: M48 family metalloprotease [Candidatus Omnitrophica bacterium]|nr:M48 family metalloprotease [Candidatus Omnitrophota bacterium]
MVKKLLLVIFAFFLSGCSTLYNPATGRNEFIMINSQTEVQLGRSVVNDFIKEHPLVRDQKMQERALAIGRKVAFVSERKDIEYNFYVIEDKELNASTFPGGFIFMNKGLMDVLNDDELAYVLAHEVGHVAARHIAKKIQSNMAYQLLLGVAFAGTGSGSGENAQTIAQGVDTVYNLISLSYSRKDEYEADRLGVKYAYLAGFNPYGAINALEKIKQGEGPSWKILGYFRTHPYVEDRQKALKTIIPEVAKKK